MTFGAPEALIALVVPAALAGLLFLRERQRTGAVRRYEDAGGSGSLAVGRSRTRRRVKAGLLLAAAFVAVFAAARPRWGSEPQPITREGADLAVVLDVSASMAAEDIQPNRLASAKAQLRTLVESLRGDRVGLVIFGATAFQRFPLTSDLGLAGALIEAQRLNSIDVEPGTSLDAGLRGGLDLLASSESPAKAIVIVSDGEDLTGEAVAAIDEARDRNVRVFAAGIGGPGATIPVRVPGTNVIEPKLDAASGQPVVTSLVDSALRRAADETSGTYVAVTPEGGSLTELFAGISGLEDVALESRQESRPVERFQLFVLVAAGLLLAELITPESSRSRRRRLAGGWRLLPAGTLVALIACTSGVEQTNDRANALFDRGRFRDALAKYREVQAERPDLLAVHYNIGATLYRLADYDRAITELQRAAQAADAELAARALYGLGNSYVRLGRLADAVTAYRSTLKLNPDDQDAKFNLELIQRRLANASPTPEGSASPGSNGTPGPDGTGTATPGSSGTPGPGTGTPDPVTGTPGTGTPGPGTGTPGTGTPGPGTGTPGPATATPTAGTPGATATPSNDEPGREAGNPEPGSTATNGSDPRSVEEQLRELLEQLQDPELSPEDALRILDAYREAQAAREESRDPGAGGNGDNDW
jgi:Ca-activated chloride channel family protein